MRARAVAGALTLGALGALALAASAAERPQAPVPPPTPAPTRVAVGELSVGIYAAPPWSMQDAGGEWHGLTVDLWRDLAADLGWHYRFVEDTPDSILDRISRGSLDTSAGPFASTLERQKELDFTHSYVVSGLGIAVLAEQEGDRWLSVLEGLTTKTALRVYAGIATLLLVAGAAMWLLERRRNAMFSGRAIQGIGSGFWWAGVTTVGVGYGDKVPVTFWGRVVALFWMFTSLIIVIAFTAFVTSKLATFDVVRIQGAQDLRRAMVGTIEGSAGTDLLHREDIAHRIYADVPSAFAALEAGEVNAVVYGAVILRYYVDRDPRRRIEVLPGRLEALDFAFPLKDGSALREPLNGALRRTLNESQWADLKDKYLGSRRSEAGTAP